MKVFDRMSRRNEIVCVFRLVWIEFQIQNDHSGFHFPIVFSPEFHDYHHLK
jgi:5-hydroxyisourate hydrolase-like protein (transthyretin family)